MNQSTDHLKDDHYHRLLAVHPGSAKIYLWIGRFDILCAVAATVSAIAALMVFLSAWLRDGWSGASSVHVGVVFFPSFFSFLLLIGSWQRFRIVRRWL